MFIVNLYAITGVAGGPHEVQLINDLLATYNSYERPAEDDNLPLKVEFQVTLRSIIDVVRQLYIIIWDKNVA